MKRTLSVWLCALFASLMFNATALAAADADEYNAAVEKTEAKLAKIAQKVQLWSTSGVLIKSAANAAEAGHFDRAIELLNEAGLHGDLALATAEREKKTWQNGVPE
jgi:hypothetical protein